MSGKGAKLRRYAHQWWSYRVEDKCGEEVTMHEEHTGRSSTQSCRVRAHKTLSEQIGQINFERGPI